MKPETVMNEPQWITSDEYEGILPSGYTETINKEEEQLDRLVMPTSYVIGRYHNKDGIVIDAIIYRYSLRTNPRNIRFGFRVFLNGEVKGSGGSLHHVDEAKMKCNRIVKDLSIE